jgi:quinol monooxygenase YgiN
MERQMLQIRSMVRLRVALHTDSTCGVPDLLEALRFIALGTRSDPGCLSASAWVDPDSVVRYVEEWATEPQMRRRVRSAPFVSLLAVVESARNPEVQFDFVSETRGLDYVAEARNNTTS